MVHSKLRQLMYDSQTCTHTHTHTHTHTQHTKSYYLQLQATQEEDVSSLFKLESKHVQVLSSKTLLPQAPSNQIEPLSTKDYGRSIAKQVTPGSHQLNDKVFTMHKGVLLWFHMGEHPGNPLLLFALQQLCMYILKPTIQLLLACIQPHAQALKWKGKKRACMVHWHCLYMCLIYPDFLGYHIILGYFLYIFDV